MSASQRLPVNLQSTYSMLMACQSTTNESSSGVDRCHGGGRAGRDGRGSRRPDLPVAGPLMAPRVAVSRPARYLTISRAHCVVSRSHGRPLKWRDGRTGGPTQSAAAHYATLSDTTSATTGNETHSATSDNPRCRVAVVILYFSVLFSGNKHHLPLL